MYEGDIRQCWRGEIRQNILEPGGVSCNVSMELLGEKWNNCYNCSIPNPCLSGSYSLPNVSIELLGEKWNNCCNCST